LYFSFFDLWNAPVFVHTVIGALQMYHNDDYDDDDDDDDV